MRKHWQGTEALTTRELVRVGSGGGSWRRERSDIPALPVWPVVATRSSKTGIRMHMLPEGLVSVMLLLNVEQFLDRV